MSDTRNPVRPELTLTVQYATGVEELPPRWRLRRWVQAALGCGAMLTLRFVDAVEARQLNRDFRGKDYATNVLTFAYGVGEQHRGIEGDIVICVPVLRDEAKRQRLPLDAHCAHLVMHGVLHAQGWDHEDGAEARRMEKLETALLARFGFGDPYRRPEHRG